MDREEYLYWVCPMIREQIYAREIPDISSGEVDDIAKDLLLEIDLNNVTEEIVCDLLDKYFETYQEDKRYEV